MASQIFQVNNGDQVLDLNGITSCYVQIGFFVPSLTLGLANLVPGQIVFIALQNSSGNTISLSVNAFDIGENQVGCRLINGGNIINYSKGQTSNLASGQIHLVLCTLIQGPDGSNEQCILALM